MGSTQVQSLRRPKPVTIEDRLEIMELSARFDLMVDRHDADGYAELFTSDGVLEHPAGAFTGREAIGQFLVDYEAAPKGNRHMALNHILTVQEDGAVAMENHMLVVRAGGDGLALLAHGLFSDQVVRTTEGWRFARRRLHDVVVQAA